MHNSTTGLTMRPKLAKVVEEESKRKVDPAEELGKAGTLKLRQGDNQIDPGYALAYQKRGSALQNLSKFPEAVADYTASYKLDHNEVAIWPWTSSNRLERISRNFSRSEKTKRPWAWPATPYGNGPDQLKVLFQELQDFQRAQLTARTGQIDIATVIGPGQIQRAAGHSQFPKSGRQTTALLRINQVVAQPVQ